MKLRSRHRPTAPEGKVIRLELFETIRLWHGQGMATREIARRLGICPKTVRRHLDKIDRGAKAPQRATPPSKLDPFLDRITELTAVGRTAWSIYEELRTDLAFTGCYDTVKRAVRRLRHHEPKVYERLEHLPGAEAQVDFTELARVDHQGRRVRTWCFQMIWPHSRWRYLEVVLDQTGPTFLGCIQRALQASGAIPQRLVPDNLTSAVLRRQMGLRPYQRDFAAFCAHYGVAPAPARVRTPTDKASVERGNGTLKKHLRGRTFATLADLQAAVTGHQRSVNARPHSQTGKVPNDLLALERRGQLPEPYPLALWSEHRVRSDCHVQVLRNFYSVPYRLAGKKVVVRVDDDRIVVFDDFVEIARHPRCSGRGETDLSPGK
ncbi:IS21 family transposase [bacterium]|nr:MAG: IS21 family transposase [bacterium]